MAHQQCASKGERPARAARRQFRHSPASKDGADVRDGVQQSGKNRDAGARRHLEQQETDGVQHAHQRRNQELSAHFADFIEQALERPIL
jgi:hypothetical protein